MATPILISLTASATNFNDIKANNPAIGSSIPTNQIVDLIYRIDLTQQGVLAVISGFILTDNIDVIPSEGSSIRNPQYLDSTAYGINYTLYKDNNSNFQLDLSDRLIDSKNITSNVSGYVVFQKSLTPGTYFLTLTDSNGTLSSRSRSSILFDPGSLYGESVDIPNIPNTVTDFNKDGNTDILMSNASQGWSGFYTMNGTTASNWVSLPYSSRAVATGAGDFNKDGNTDILMSNASQGWSGFYTMNGTTASNWVSLTYSSGAVATGAGDFNKDGNTDILMSNASQGWSGFYTMNGTTASSWVSLPYSSGAVAM